MADCVWWVGNTGLEKSHFRFNITTPDFKTPDRAHRVRETVRAGQQVPPGDIPETLQRPAPARAAALPHLFHSAELWFISAKVKTVLDGFDLGSAQIEPVELRDVDGQTLRQAYFWLAPGNPQTLFSRDASPAVLQNDLIYGAPPPPRSMASFFAFQDGDVKVDRQARLGPAIWVDPRFVSSFFLQDAVVEALRRAKADKDFHFRRADLLDSVSR